MAGRYSVTPSRGNEDALSRSSAGSTADPHPSGDGIRPRPTGGQITDARRTANLARLRHILTNPDISSRNPALAAHLSRLDTTELEEIATWIHKPGSPLYRHEDVLLVVHAWVKVEPMKALDTLNTLQYSLVIDPGVFQWALVDMEAATLWARRNSKPNRPCGVGIVRALALTDLPRATEVMEEFAANFKSSGWDDLCETISPDEPSEIRSWIDSINNDELRIEAIRGCTSKLTGTDPVKTLTWLADPKSPSHDSFPNVFSQWAEKDFSAAQSFFESLPSGTARTMGLARLVSNSSGEDEINGPLALIARYPDDVNPDLRSRALFQHADHDPAAALAKVSTIAAPDDINSTYSEILLRWRFHDSEAARAWVDGNELPQEVREEFEKGRELPSLDLFE